MHKTVYQHLSRVQIYPVYVQGVAANTKLSLTCGKYDSIFVKTAYILNPADTHFAASFQTQAVLGVCGCCLLVGHSVTPLGEYMP